MKTYAISGTIELPSNVDINELISAMNEAGREFCEEAEIDLDQVDDISDDEDEDYEDEEDD